MSSPHYSVDDARAILDAPHSFCAITREWLAEQLNAAFERGAVGQSGFVAEIERLKKELTDSRDETKRMIGQWNSATAHADCLQAENARLQASLTAARNANVDLTRYLAELPSAPPASPPWQPVPTEDGWCWVRGLRDPQFAEQISDGVWVVAGCLLTATTPVCPITRPEEPT